MEPASRCDIFSQIQKLWNFRYLYNSPTIYNQKIKCPEEIPNLLSSYAKEATYQDIVLDIDNLLHILELYTTQSMAMDPKIFKVLLKAVNDEKSNKNIPVSIKIIENKLIRQAINGSLFVDGTQFIEKSKVLVAIAKENQKNLILSNSDSELEIVSPLPENLDFRSLKRLKNLAEKGKYPECVRICENYGFSFCCVITDNIIGYKVDSDGLEIIHCWLELTKVITQHVDASIFKECFAKGCPGCMMITLCSIAKFLTKSSDHELLETIVRNLLHDKEGTFVERGELKQLGKNIFRNLIPRYDKYFGGNCLDIGLNNKLTFYFANLGKLACSKQFAKEMNENQKRVEYIIKNNALLMSKEDGYKDLINLISTEK